MSPCQVDTIPHHILSHDPWFVDFKVGVTMTASRCKAGLDPKKLGSILSLGSRPRSLTGRDHFFLFKLHASTISLGTESKGWPRLKCLRQPES